MNEIVNAAPATLLFAWIISLVVLGATACVIAVAVARADDRSDLAACLREVARIVAALRGKSV